MGKIVQTFINKFDGGIRNDPRDPSENTAKIVTNFDVFSNPSKMTPYRSKEAIVNSGNQLQNFCTAIRSGTTHDLFMLGQNSSKANILAMKIAITGGNDLSTITPYTPNFGAQTVGSLTHYELFLYYKKVGLVLGARDNRYIWAFDPTSVLTFQDTYYDTGATFTNIAQGIVHSNDDIAYIPIDNKIYYNNNGSWGLGITLPNNYYISSICEFGIYLAIACAPLSGVGNSRVFLWDRNTSSVLFTGSVDWGDGNIRVLEEIEGYLVGISISGGNSLSTRFFDNVIFKYYSNAPGAQSPQGAVEFQRLTGTLANITGVYPAMFSFPIAKQKVNNRIYFMLAIKLLNGLTAESAVREGVWSITKKPGDGFALVHERTPNDDTALTTGQLKGFFVVGDFMFISYVSSGTYGLSKTDDQATFGATSIYEKRFNGGDSSLVKDLVGISVMTEPLPSTGSVTLKYLTDQNTSYTTIFTNTTLNSLSYSVEGLSGLLPKNYKELQLRIESTGGAEITAYSFEEEITGKRNY